MDIVQEALTFATNAHEGQTRKYSGEPYVVHPIQVMTILKDNGIEDEEMFAAALLHDVLEDTVKTEEDIFRAVRNQAVVLMVRGLSDVSAPSDGNRKARKAIDREHTAKQSPRTKTIKIADCLSNGWDIFEHDRNFAKVYFKEMELLLPFLKEGDNTLWDQLSDLIELAKKEIGIKMDKPKDLHEEFSRQELFCETVNAVYPKTDFIEEVKAELLEQDNSPIKWTLDQAMNFAGGILLGTFIGLFMYTGVANLLK